MDHLDPPTHRMRALGLVGRRLGRQANRRMHLLHRRLHALLQLHTAAQHRQTFTGLASRLTNGRHGFPRALLQGTDMRLDIASGALRLARQGPHLIRHHGKPATGFTRPRRLDGRVQGQQVGLLGNPVNHRQHHFNLFTLLRQPLDHLGTGVHLPGQGFDQIADLVRRPGVFIGRLTNIHHLLQRRLHRMTFGLGVIGHLRQFAQALRHFVTLQIRGGIGTRITQGHLADFHSSALGHIPRFPHDRLQFVDKTVHRRGHVTDFIIAVELNALGQVTLSRRQVIQRRNQQMQLVDHPPPEHHRQQQQYAKTDQRQAHANPPAQGLRRILHGCSGIGLHLRSRGLSRLQAGLHGLGTVRRRPLQTVAHQFVAAGDQGSETLVQRLQLGLDRGRGNPHPHLADFHSIGADRGLDVVDRWIALRRVEHLVQRSLALTLGQKGLVDLVFPIQVAGQVFTGRIVIDHEQDIRIALGATGEFGKGWHIVIPHGPRGHGSQ